MVLLGLRALAGAFMAEQTVRAAERRDCAAELSECTVKGYEGTCAATAPRLAQCLLAIATPRAGCGLLELSWEPGRQ